MIPNIEAARKFVAALKSGDYDQVRGTLISYPGETRHPKNKGVCYCAEGVLVLTALSGGFERHLAVFDLGGESWREGGFLSDEVLVTIFGQWVPIRVWNDAQELSFSEIAERLEEMFPELKV